jgi:hypothetical protein
MLEMLSRALPGSHGEPSLPWARYWAHEKPTAPKSRHGYQPCFGFAGSTAEISIIKPKAVPHSSSRTANAQP